MDSPIPQSSSAHSNSRERRALLIIIIVVALGVLGWLAYDHFLRKADPYAERQAVIDQLAADSASIQVSDEEKAAAMGQVAEESSGGGLTDEEKADILKSISGE